MPRLLIVVSSAGTLALGGGRRIPAGYFAEDGLTPYERFTAGGVDVVVATPDGEPPPVDPYSLEPVFHHDGEDCDFLSAVTRSFASRPEDVRVTLDHLAGFDLIAGRRLFEALKTAGWEDRLSRRTVEAAARVAWRDARNLVDVLAGDADVTAAVPAGRMRRIAMRVAQDSSREAAAVAERLASTPYFCKPERLADLDDAEILEFDAVFVPGGLGALAGLAGDPDVGRVLRLLHRHGRIIAAAGLGTAALLAAGGRPGGEWLFDGFRLTALTDEELGQTPAGRLGTPWTVEAALKNAGAVFEAAPAAWTPHVVVDRNVMTAQNPMSIGALADGILGRLVAAPPAPATGSFPPPAAGGGEFRPAEVADRFFDALHHHDLDRVLNLVDEDAEVDFVPAGLSGRAAVEGQAFLEAMLSAFPDLTVGVANTIPGGDGTLVAEVTLEGTQATAFDGIANQEKHVDVRQAWMLAVAGGRIRRLRAFWCQNQLYRRLGVRRIDRAAIDRPRRAPARRRIPDAPGDPAVVTVRQFFDAFARHDPERMVGRCRAAAEFAYVPIELWGRQRVVRGEGNVGTVGKVLWTGQFEAFPDLGCEITSITSDGAGNVAAEVFVDGTQARDWGTVGTQGRRFQVPHLFVFRVAGDGFITRVAAYWDDADLRAQLGTLEVD